MAGHPPGPSLAERVVEPSADQEVGDVGHQDREDADAREHQQDRPHPQPPRLGGKAEVSVAHRRHRLDAEVERRQERHSGLAVLPPEQQGRARDQQHQQGECTVEAAVELSEGCAQGAREPGNGTSLRRPVPRP